MNGDGGPASAPITTNESPKVALYHVDLRDYFAAHALNWLLTRHYDGQAISVRPGPEHVAKAAYELADAMLAERSGQ